MKTHHNQQTFICPYCKENTSVVVIFDDTSGTHSYVEDCESCSQPIQINYEVDAGKVVSILADQMM